MWTLPCLGSRKVTSDEGRWRTGEVKGWGREMERKRDQLIMRVIVDLKLMSHSTPPHADNTRSAGSWDREVVFESPGLLVWLLVPPVPGYVSACPLTLHWCLNPWCFKCLSTTSFPQMSSHWKAHSTACFSSVYMAQTHLCMYTVCVGGVRKSQLLE